MAAAIQSARVGARTLVVEALGSLGGTQANGWVTPMMPNYLDDFKLDRGINEEIVAAQRELQGAGDAVPHADVWYDPVGLALVLDRIVAKAGVEVLLGATVAGASASDGKVGEIEVVARGGRLRLEGRCYVDATGDGELAALAGAEMLPDEGRRQPMTLRFAMGGLDLSALSEGLPGIWRTNAGGYLEAGYGELKESPLGDSVRAAIASGMLEEDDLGYWQVFTMNGRPGELAFNCPRIAGFDPLDPFALSEAYRIGREKIARIAAFTRTLPGCAAGYVSAVAPLMGIRESRRVRGEYVLTGEDHAGRVKFEDVIARNRYPVDIHLARGILHPQPYPPGEWHDVPYRSLVVRGFSNLWVAGRCLSADFVAQSAVRIQPVCRSMGAAAGAAAALCARSGLSAQSLRYPDLAAWLDLALPAPD